MSIPELAYASLEQALNQHLSMDPDARAEIAQLHGKVIGLEIMGTGQTIYLTPGPEMIQLFGSYEGEPDCLLQGSPMTIVQLRSEIPEGATAIPEEMQIQGDLELAEQFCRSLRRVKIDWEQYISQYTGSLIAGEVGKVIGFAGYWRDHIADTLKQDMQELLQHEASFLPGRDEVAKFGSEVTHLSERLEQLKQRVSNIQNNKSS
jgi:ubiquinone biosynthesis protein UbiJ